MSEVPAPKEEKNWSRMKIGEILVGLGKLTEAELQLALKKAALRQEALGAVLLTENIVTEIDLGTALAHQAGLDFMDLADIRLDKKILKSVPERVAKKYMVLPLLEQKGKLVIAIDDPTKFIELNFVRQLVGGEVVFVVSPASQLRRLVEKAYIEEQSGIENIANKLHKVTVAENKQLDITAGREERKEEKKGAPAANRDALSIETLVSEIIDEAMERKASDIHIDP